MPELPEVSTVVQDIRPFCIDKRILDFVCVDKGRPPNVLISNLLARKVKDIYRHGKYIIFNLSYGYMVSHLRMTGQWHKNAGSEHLTSKHLRWAIQLSDGNWLAFTDVRRFGTLDYYDRLEDCPSLNALGFDGLSINDSDVQMKIQEAASKSNKPIKNFLMDQSVIAGNGNIYASQSLWDAMVSPLLPANEVVDRIPEICSCLYKLFVLSIENRGSSISDYEGGEFQNFLNVYGQEGKPCTRCGTNIERIVQAGRSTFYCPNCQI